MYKLKEEFLECFFLSDLSVNHCLEKQADNSTNHVLEQHSALTFDALFVVYKKYSESLCFQKTLKVDLVF